MAPCYPLGSLQRHCLHRCPWSPPQPYPPWGRRVIPQKLVNKVRLGKFLDLKELSQDNVLRCPTGGVAGAHILASCGGYSTSHARDHLLAYYSATVFLAYAAAMTSDPVTRDQLAYARLIIQQAQRQSGHGWMDYDRAFRQQIAADHSLK
jgi:hypothetical protein